MSKLLSLLFTQKISGYNVIRTPNTTLLFTMSKRTRSFHRTPKFKPETKSVTVQSMLNSNPRLKEKVEVLPEPIKSESDKKLYKAIKLPNGLTVLLISDPSLVAEQSDSSSDEGGISTGSSEVDTDEKSDQSASSDKPSSSKKHFDEEKLAACALCVGVGSYSDPPDIQGLAHFVEHMVFMGSSKYPKENEFDAYVKKKGGSDNASTDCEHTTFYFEIQEKYLPHAMDMFSQFFVSPLMKKDAMQREREAIESEFAIAAPLDSNRKEQLLASLFPEGHPARTFTWGNARSLFAAGAGGGAGGAAGGGGGGAAQAQHDEELHRAAHRFRLRHYSAHRMTLAVQARMDLSMLEEYVTSTFGQIPNNGSPPDDFTPHKHRPELVTEEFRSLYYVKPVSDASEIHLTWCMRSLITEYESKPHQYISYLLGHEGKGSLLSYLRKKVWALGLYTGNSESGIDYTSMYSLFSTQIVLTKDGLEHIDEVIAALFSYLEMLRKLGPSKRIYEEIKTIEENSFRFEEEQQPSDYVETLAENMHHYPSQHYITGDRLYYKYDPEGIKQLLDSMQPDNVNIMIVSNKHAKPIEYDAKEKWFGTEYRKEDIPKPWLDKWMSVRPYSEFSLPAKNIYITTNFDIVEPAAPYQRLADELNLDLTNTTTKSLYNVMETMEPKTVVFSEGDLMATVNNFRLDQPNLLRKNKQMELWYKPDFKWKFPTALLYFYFITPLSLRSPRDACLLDLWNDVFQQGMKEDVYPADMADLSHTLFVSDKGLQLKVSGYSQNLHLLVELVSVGMRSAALEATGSLFEAVRDVRARIYHNVLIKPAKLAKDVRMNILLEPYISPRDKAKVIQDITLAELQEFSARLFDNMYVQVLVEGNLRWTDAISISQNVVKNIKCKGLEEDELPNLQVRKIPLGENIIRVMSLNKQSTNSIITNYYQSGFNTPQDTAILEIIMMLMEEPVFDTLRTKEQLGYSVFCMMRYTFGVLGYSVSVNTQVNKFSVYHVDRRVEAFLKKFSRDMKKLNTKTLSSTKQALIQLKHNIDYELKEEMERYWREITGREYRFQRLFEEAAAIELVNTNDIKGWVERHFASGNKENFRKLSIQIMGHQADSNVTTTQADDSGAFELKYVTDSVDNVTEDKDNFIQNISEFRKTLPIIQGPPVELAQC